MRRLKVWDARTNDRAHVQMSMTHTRTHNQKHTHTHIYTPMAVRRYLQTEICVHAADRRDASLFEHKVRLLHKSSAFLFPWKAVQVLFDILTFYILWPQLRSFTLRSSRRWHDPDGSCIPTRDMYTTPQMRIPEGS